MGQQRGYQDLIAWQKAYALARQVYALTLLFPKQEAFGLSSQARRSAVSIASNIAEGYQRYNRKEFNNFVRISFGSAAELETQLLLAKDAGFIVETTFQETQSLLQEVCRLLHGLRTYLR